ncbi:MAG: 4-(cytidine 5'-diphospho)-2-C-methyl-D-erythritol kinase, partial [Clostridia bacterium]|nr:4-(cytidine 5'-diphospho)-2-C-methyl-D-erythritol kinase [Clostridia bacterium]
MKVSREAHAKINLFLSVGDRRPDGFHDILSVMHAVSLSDTVTLEVEKAPERTISLKSDGDVPDGPSNLAWRACEAFLRKTGIDGYRIAIRLEKRIPVAGGLAGGSTDAAATLVLLNGFFGDVLSPGELLDLGGSIGSDVPFCILGGTVLARGRGEKLTPVSISEKYH